MKAALVPPNEVGRLAAVRAFGRLEALSTEALDALARAASRICETPFALISLIDETDQHFIANVGMQGTKTPRPLSMCTHAILGDELMVVEDTTNDPRFAHNPYVVADPQIRFYAGMPLVDAGGFAIGTICVFDRVARKLSDSQAASLRDLAIVAMAQISARIVASSTEHNHELLAMAEDVAGFGHYQLDVAAGHLYWSPQVFRVHGRDPATYTPELNNALDCYHPEDKSRVSEIVARALVRGEGYDFESRVVRPNGEVRRVISKGVCEIDPATGRTATLFGVFQDITERETLRERLFRQERLATTGTLAAGVGHEINNPLAFLTTNLDVAVEELATLAGASPSQRMRDLLAVLEDARSGADRIRKIVRGLRSFARQDTITAPTDVRAALETSLNIATHELRQRATVTKNLGAVPRVMADEAQLSQVFVNLLVNAAQAFTVANPETNQIAISTETNAAGSAVIEISDNGPGVPPEIASRIFDPFFTTKAPGKGTGLGLAISHSIITTLGGEISLRSRAGGGSLFRVVLPAASQVVPEVGVVEIPIAAGARGRILVVDDEPMLLRSLARLLSDHECVAIADSREALRILEEQGDSFDVVFSDILMPHLSGIDLYRKTLAFAPDVAARFVFMTGDVVRQDVRTFLASVPNERLEKPFNNHSVRSIANRYISGRDRVADDRG